MDTGGYDLTTFAGRLAYARKVVARIESQSALAREVGIKPQAIQQLEAKGYNGRSLYTVEIAMVLGVRPEWLATGQEPMLPGGEASPPPTLQALDEAWDSYPKALKIKIVESVQAARESAPAPDSDGVVTKIATGAADRKAVQARLRRQQRGRGGEKRRG